MDFSRRSRAANSPVRSLIWLKFELIQVFIVVLVTCKNEEDPIKIEGTRVLTSIYVGFSDAQGELICSQRWNTGEIGTHPSFMLILATCKNEKDPIKHFGTRVLTTFHPL